ncbi:MAG: flagellin [Alphaproteobacteria bacterium]|jgi:flagellin|nr:flagellin [Rhizobiaceae bacterium]MBC7148811.1 flagellin [Rhizobium sp.]MBU3962191.1 flagellin [Alphaproteobacteria bacterium]MBU4050501.1 flagellin [Alphaproteobacteria bacterium]MBU4087843.1 flagellin [Alphaproteobacteria bacterium]
MTSIMTNTAAMAALQTLRSIDSNMQETQARVSSGYRVATAADNAAYWSIATTMRSDNSALSTVQDALGLGAAKTDTAYTGLESAVEVVTEIKSKLVAAREPGVDKSKINKELSELKNQLAAIAESASFSGENWLFNESTAAPGTKEIVASFNRASDGAVSVTTLAFDTSESVLIDTKDANNGVLTKGFQVTQPSGSTTTIATYFLIDANATTGATGSEVKLTTSMSDDELDGMISAVDAMLQRLTDSASTLGAITSRIEMQDEFVSTLMDVIDKGVGRLVDADMNEESTRLKALQTQQQLGIQALSIANTNAENILTLFK